MEPSPPRPEESPNDETVCETVLSRTVPAPRAAEPLPRGRFMVLLLFYGFVDFLGPVLLVNTAGHDPWVFATLFSGALAGQGTFLAIWAALGPFRLWNRWGLILLTVLGLYFSVIFGIFAAVGNLPPPRDMASMAASLLLIPLIFLLTQTPLWFRRVISGWRIVPIDEVEQHSAIKTRQFGLAHILGLMLMLGVALSLVQLASPALAPSRMRPAEAQAELWAGVASMCGLFLLYCAVWAGPALRACFLARDKALGCFAMIGAWLGVSALTVFVFLFITLATGGNRMPGEAVAAIFLHFAGLAVVLTASLHVLRACGHAMIRAGGKPLREPAEEGVSPFSLDE
ncbi:MAG TPA: hypothetical protein VJL29_01025 [Thermoguttaceae bacterium]|nr:hypothetical protein [Thermoguttaceae bacterium]